MRRNRLVPTVLLVLAMVIGAVLVESSMGTDPTAAQGVGDASWTPSRSSTTTRSSRFITADDSVVFRTDAVWDQGQARGLSRYLGDGLRYTQEINDRRGRLSATGFWATNLPDPAYDRDDDDGDGRWEEAEIIAGATRPVAGRSYTTLVQFSRWHAKRARGRCDWAWDRRLGASEVLSQLSRDLLGEWQAQRYTLTYDSLEYPRVGRRPAMPDPSPKARCSDPRAGPGQHGFVVTFSEPLAWDDLVALPGAGSAKWTAFEAIGSSDLGGGTWTCGGPVTRELADRPCAELGIDLDGVVAAVAYLDDEALRRLEERSVVAEVSGLQDSLTGLLFDVGGFGVGRPGLTVNDRYWDLFLAE